MDEYASLENCKKLYGVSGWLTDKVWLRSKAGWSIELATTYQKNPTAWLEWGAPAYTPEEVTGKLAAQSHTRGVPADLNEACLYALDLFDQDRLQPSKEG